MTGIVCLDQEDGLLFNGRRQSRDRVVTKKILSMTEGKPLWMSAYSRRIFPEDAPVCVAEDLVGKLAEPARKDAEQVESAQEELEREEAAQKEPWQQPGEAAFCLIEEAVNLENEMIDGKKTGRNFSAKQRNLRTGQKISGKSRKRDYEKRKMEQTAF